MSELAFLRLESAIAFGFTLVSSGYAIYFFARVRRIYATYAALANVMDLLMAAFLLYIAISIPSLVYSWPDSFPAHAIRWIPVAGALMTIGFIYKLVHEEEP